MIEYLLCEIPVPVWVLWLIFALAVAEFVASRYLHRLMRNDFDVVFGIATAAIEEVKKREAGSP